MTDTIQVRLTDQRCELGDAYALKHMTTPEPVSQRILLSERELEILTLVAAGKSNHAIAEQLLISDNTVKYHLKNILHKLGVSNRTEAVTLAMQMGYL